MKRIITMLEASSIEQSQVEKFLFYAMIYFLAFAAGFQFTGLA